jgi:hypothetical protein
VLGYFFHLPATFLHRGLHALLMALITDMHDFMKIQNISLLLSALTLAACSSASKVKKLSELKTDERVIVGKIEMVKPISEFVTGIYGSSSLIVSDKLPVDEKGKISNFKLLNHGSVAECGFGKTGCSFQIKMKKTKSYLTSIRAASTVVVVTNYYGFPLFLEIPESSDACSYVGRIRVTLSKTEKPKIEILNDFLKENGAVSQSVEGCTPKYLKISQVPYSL